MTSKNTSVNDIRRGIRLLLETHQGGKIFLIYRIIL